MLLILFLRDVLQETGAHTPEVSSMSIIKMRRSVTGQTLLRYDLQTTGAYTPNKRSATFMQMTGQTLVMYDLQTTGAYTPRKSSVTFMQMMESLTGQSETAIQYLVLAVPLRTLALIVMRMGVFSVTAGTQRNYRCALHAARWECDLFPKRELPCYARRVRANAGLQVS